MNTPCAEQRAHQLTEALDLWVKLTGVDPGANSFTISLSGGMDSYTVSQMHKALKEALDLDPSNITAHLLLDAFSSHYFKHRSFSVEELLENPERAAAYAAKAKQFRALAQSPEIMDIGESFALAMRQAVRHYGADSEAVLKVIEDRHELAYLRRDALRSMERLRVDQFLSGKPEAEGVKPAYNGIVHQFWNINSLINAACGQPSGVTLNLVRDPDCFQSYFAFAIRNGGNLFVLSDVPVHSHPLQRYMTRRPDRDFDRRSSRNWFPYDLLNIKYDENANRLYFDADAQRGLIPLQQEADQLKPLAELAPKEIVWIVMMFDLIVERFWRQGYQAPALSYTGQMIREETPLLAMAERANLPVIGYQPLSLPALTVEEVSGDQVSEEALGDFGGSPNRWLEERYASSITDEVLNLVSRSGVDYYLPPAKDQHGRGAKNHPTAIVSANQVVSVDSRKDKQLPSWDKQGRYGLHALDGASFGTRTELEHNRAFLARHNMAKAIQRLADQEYEARKEEIEQWWRTALDRKIERIYGMATVTESWRPLDHERFPQAEISVSGWYREGMFPFVKRWSDEEWRKNRIYMSEGGVGLHQGYRQRGGTFLCHVTGAASSYRVLFQPQTATDLAYLLDCRIEDLPDVLQHWCRKTDYAGNAILNRIDPMAWALRNPWSRMSFDVALYLSVRGLKSILKRYQAPDDLLPGEPVAKEKPIVSKK